MSEFSTWIKTYLQDPKVTDLCLNSTRTLHLDRGDGLEALELPKETRAEEIKNWALEQLSQAGKTWDARHPFVDATLSSGHRIHVAFPPIAKAGVLISLRRLATAGTHLPGERWHNSPLFEHLRQAVIRGDSVLIGGATGSGKTTLASDLLSCVNPRERIIALEDTAELAPSHPHFISLVSRTANADGFGEVTLRTLLRQTLRMRPDRIILGECRGPEVLELLQALNTGHHGALATLHANSPREALRRIELLCLLSAAGAIPLSAIRELLALGIQWIAQVRRLGSQRVISELWKLEGREGDTLLMRPIIAQN